MQLEKRVAFRRAMRGVLVSFVGLLAALAVSLGMAVPWGVPGAILAAVAFVALRLKVDVLWVVLAGAARGGYPARRRSTSPASDGFARSRPDRIGRPSGVPGTAGHGTAASGSSQAKPSSSVASYTAVTK